MKKIWLLTVVMFLGFVDKKPIEWKINLKNKEVGKETSIVFEAKLLKNWYVYGTDIQVSDGPLATKIVLEPNDTYEIIGNLKAIDPKSKYDEIWDGNITYFKDQGVFVQNIKILKPNFKITGKIVAQTCSEIDGNCVLNTKEFKFE